MTEKDCGCPPHMKDHKVGRNRLEVDGENVSVAFQLRCGRCAKDTIVTEPHDPEKHGPRVGKTTVESLEEYQQRTRAAYAAEAAKIRADLIELVSDAIYSDATTTNVVDGANAQEVADRCDQIAEIAVDTVAEFLNRQQPFVETTQS